MKPTWNRLLPLAAGLALLVLTIAQIRGSRAGAASPPLNTPDDAAGSASVRITAEGRLVAYPGAEVVVGSDLSGTVERVLVEEKQEVKAGQLLAELRADDLRAELAEARARTGEAQADLDLFRLEVTRAERLVAAGVEAPETADRQRRSRDAALARLTTAQAAVRRLEAVLAKTRLLAPITGVITTKFVHSGETVAAGASVVTIADLRRTRVEAEVDEFDAARIEVGASVTVTAEGHAAAGWSGRVEEIPDAVVARRLKPQDPGRPQDPRVLLVKVALDQQSPLKLGQRVEVAISAD